MSAAMRSMDTYRAKAQMLIKLTQAHHFGPEMKYFQHNFLTTTTPRGSTDDRSAFPVPGTFMAETAVWSMVAMGIGGQLLCNTAYIASP